MFVYLTETSMKLEGSMKDIPSSQFFSLNTNPTEQEFSPGSFFDFFGELFQQEMAPFFSGLNRTTPFRPSQWAPPLREPECAFCHSKTEDLKRCFGCRKVFYCGKQCQKQHWKEHKPHCQKDS